MALKREKSEKLSLDKEEILEALSLLKNGDFSNRLSTGFTGIDGKIADTYNEIVQIESETIKETERIYREIVEEGKTRRCAISVTDNDNLKMKNNALFRLINVIKDSLMKTIKIDNAPKNCPFFYDITY